LTLSLEPPNPDKSAIISGARGVVNRKLRHVALKAKER